MGCKTLGIGAAFLYLLQKAPTSENGAGGGMGKPHGLRGMLRQTEGRSGKTAGNVGSLPGRFSYPRSPQGCPGTAVMPLSLEQGACVSRRRPPKETRCQCGMGGPMGLRWTTRQAKQRRGNTARNAGRLLKRTLPYQKPPGLS